VDPGLALASGLTEAAEGIEAALERIRELGHGIYPQALRHGGLSPALASAADQLPLPIMVHADGLRRVAPEIETAVYFCCLEALQNVAKHATSQTPVDVRLTATAGELRFNVADRGPGFDPRLVRHGHGLTGMRDRLGAIGGEIEIVSRPGHGATITGRVPLKGA
jgi:signal transduction histidine kinase